MIDGGYRDFIPAGEDTGGAGAGYQDFVPPKEPAKQPEEPTPAPKATGPQGPAAAVPQLPNTEKQKAATEKDLTK